MALRLSTGLRQGLLGTADFDTIFTNCFINIYSGVQPANADAAAIGSLLATIYSNNPTDTLGLEFDNPIAGVISKAIAETWAGAGLLTGTAGWFRMWAAGDDPSILSTTEERVDGNIATSGANMNMTNTSIVAAAVQTISAFSITFPGS